QVGGGNAATGSLGAAQVSHSKSSTSVDVKRGDTHVTASIPTSIGGSGDTTRGSTGAVAIQPTTGGVHIAGNAGPAAPEADVDVAASANRTLGDTLGVNLAELGTYPGSATAATVKLVQQLMPQILPAGVSADIGLQQLIDSGTLQLGSEGDDLRLDL